MSVRIGSGNQVVLSDQNQIEVGTVDDGYSLRLQVEAALKPGTSINTGGGVPENPDNILRAFLKNGNSDNLLVNGSTTPVQFELSADPDLDIRINELRFVLSMGQVQFTGSMFGNRPELTNGILVEVQSNGNYAILANVRINEEFLSFNAPGNLVLMGSGSEDVIVSGLNLAGAIVLKANSADYVRVTIRDNITHPTYHHFRCALYGYKEEGNE